MGKRLPGEYIGKWKVIGKGEEMGKEEQMCKGERLQGNRWANEKILEKGKRWGKGSNIEW